MIERLVIRNWKSHYRTEVKFEPGTNVIIGINGAGKSSVLEAIYFALFGPPERKNFYERTLRSGEKEGYVELTFTHNGKRYTVKRWFDHKQQRDARIEGDEKVITSRPRDVDEKIVEILGMDGKTFRDAVYARQNEMASILLDSKRRKELIDEMIEISEFSRMRDSILALRNRLKDWLRGIAAANVEERLKRLEEQREQKKRDLEDARRTKESLTAKVAELKKELEAAETELDNISREYNALRKKKTEFEEKRGKIRAIRERIEVLRGEVEDLEANEEKIRTLRLELQEVKELERRLTELNARRKSIEQELEEKSKIVASVSADESAEERLKEVEEMKERMEMEYRRITERIAGLTSEIRSLKERISDLKKRYTEAREREKELEKIREQYGDAQKMLEERQRRVQELLEEISRTDNEIKREEEFVSALEGADRCPVCGSNLGKERVAEIKTEHERKLEELRSKIQKLRKKLEEEQRAVRELSSVAKRAMILAEGAENAKELEKIIGEAEDTLKEREDELRAAEKERKEIEEKLQALKAVLEDLKRRVDAAKRKKIAVEEVERLRRTLKEVHAEIDATESKLSGRRSEKIEELIRRMEKAVELRILKEEEILLAKRIKELGADVARLEEIEKRREDKIREISRIRAEINSMHVRLADVETRIATLERELKDIEREIDDSRRTIEEIEKRRKIHDILNRMLPAVETAREKVREARIRAINKALNIVWRGLYPRRDITEIRLRPEANDYVLEVKREGKWIPVQNLSGGEFYDAALALRIAISALKAKDLGLLILDEPTHNLDADATEALAHLLNQLPEYGLFRQIIVITHDETLQKAATGTVYLFERDKDHNKPTEVKKLAITHEI